MTLQDIALRPLRGSKGSDSPTETSDNLFSTDVVEALFGISEGPIKGLVDGAKTYYIGETPLRDDSGSNNFDNFELVMYKGTETGENIRSRLGGFGASTTVGTELASGVAVTRTGTHTQINYLDVRLVINQLVKSNEKGTFNHTGKFKIWYKKVSESTWTPVRTAKNNPLPPQISGDSFDVFYGDEGTLTNISAAPGDRPTFIASTQPITTANAAIWFNSASSYQPKVNNGSGWVVPTGAVFASGFWTWTERSSWGKDKSTKAYVGTKLPKNITYEQGDYWIDTANTKAWFFNGSTWIEAGSSLRPGTFGENGTGGDVTIEDGEVAITAKTTQPFVKEFRIPVAAVSEPYMLRVTKSTGANTSEKFFDITWESFQEVTAKAFNFPALATTQLVARASEQFSSLPDFSGIYDGRIVRVPSNYNEVTRAYTGVWDGLWKLRYTNNPAYIAYDLVSNDRYGMNAYYPVVLNKWDVYEAGQWCDTLTADGQPRFTYNGLISDPRGGRDAINFMCGIFAGRFFDDGNGTGVIKIDKDAGPSAIFTPENVVDGLFTYSFTDITTRHNDVTVTFINPDLNWAEDRRRVYDADSIAANGRIPHDFIAVGCTDVKEAIVRARYHLITGLREKRMVNFKTNRMGLYMSPYDVVLIADEDMGGGLTGRVAEVTGARQIKLREPIYIEPGFNYRISFQLISGATNDFVIETRTLTSGSTGARQTIFFNEDLPPLPQDAVFTIEQTNGTAAPVAFRVLSITEVDGDPDNVDIQAIEMYRAKWLFIDGLIGTIGDVDEYVLESKKTPKSVTALRVRVKTRSPSGKPITSVLLDWNKSPTKTVSGYVVRGSRDNGPMVTLGQTDTTEFELDNLQTGEYLFEVVAVDFNGLSSKPRTIEHRMVGDWREIIDIDNLRMLAEPSATVFDSRSPRFKWDRVVYDDFKRYIVRVRDASNNLIRTEYTTVPEYVYAYADNKSDNGAPLRTFKINVASEDRFGFTSDFSTLQVNNPAPASPGFEVKQYGTTLHVKIEKPADLDVAGYFIWMSTSSTFTPGPSNLVYDGRANVATIPSKRGKTYYVVCAAYDTFDKTTLNLSAQVMTIAGVTVSDDQAPSIPLSLSSSSSGDTDQAGHVRSMVKFDWADHLTSYPTETFFDHYEVEVREEGVAYTSSKMATSKKSFRAKTGEEYSFRVRACDGLGNKSPFTAWNASGSIVTAAGDTIGPEKAIINTVTGRTRGMQLKLTECAATDYKMTRYWRYTSLANANADNGTGRTYLGTGSENFHDNDLLVAGQQYWYRAAHVDKTGNPGAKSDPVSGIATGVTSDDIDQSAPNAPTSVVVTTVAADQDSDGSLDPSLEVNWVAGAVDATHPAAKGYELEIWRSATLSGTYTKWRTRTSGDTDSMFEANTTKFHRVRVRAQAFNGEWSTWSSLSSPGVKPIAKTATVAPVTGVYAVARPKTNLVRWNKPTAPDHDYCKVWRYQGTATNPGAAIYIGSTKADRFIDSDEDLVHGLKYWYYVTAVDRLDTESAKSTGYACEFAAISEADTDQTPPADLQDTPTFSPTATDVDRDGTVDIAGICTWDLNTTQSTNPIVGYMCYLYEAGALIDSRFTSARAVTYKVKVGVSFYVRIRTVGFNGIVSTNYKQSNTLTHVGRNSPPENPAGLVVLPGIQSNTLNWAECADTDYSYTKIFCSTTGVGTGSVVGQVSGTTWTHTKLENDKLYFYRIRHYNRSGVFSTEYFPLLVNSPSPGRTKRVITGDLEYSSVSAAVQLSVPSQVYIRKPIPGVIGGLNWVGGTGDGTTTLFFPNTTGMPVDNLNPNPINLAGSMSYTVMPRGPSNGLGDGVYTLHITVELQRQYPGSSTWTPLKTLYQKKTFGRSAQLVDFSGALNIADTDIPPSKDSPYRGDWKYRVMLQFKHYRSDNDFTEMQVRAAANIKYNWLKR